MKKEKEFDSVAFMRQQRERLSRELDGKTLSEIQGILQRRLKASRLLRDLQR